MFSNTALARYTASYSHDHIRWEKTNLKTAKHNKEYNSVLQPVNYKDLTGAFEA